ARASTMTGAGFFNAKVAARPPAIQTTNKLTPILLGRFLGFILSTPIRFSRYVRWVPARAPSATRMAELPAFAALIVISLQLLYQRAPAESGRARARDKIRPQLRQTALPLYFVLLYLFLSHKGAHSLLRLDNAADLEFAIRAHHGIRINRQIHRHLPHR